MRMRVIKTSKDQALLVSNSSKVQAKGKSKKRETKAIDLKSKQNQKNSEGASASKKKKFEKNLCPYFEKGYHLEDHFMRKEIDEMSSLLKEHNISSPREKNPDEESHTYDIERCHALKATISPSSTYKIDSGASNHMVASK